MSCDNDTPLGVPALTTLHQRTSARDTGRKTLADADYERAAVWSDSEIGRDPDIIQSGHVTETCDTNGFSELLVTSRR